MNRTLYSFLCTVHQYVPMLNCRFSISKRSNCTNIKQCTIQPDKTMKSNVSTI